MKSLDGWTLLPLPLPEKPVRKPTRSCRLRQRMKRRLQTWRIAVGMVHGINSLAVGMTDNRLTSSGRRQVKNTTARHLALQRITRDASVVARARRELVLTGVRHSAAAMLMKTSLDHDGYIRDNKVRQTPMCAERMVEPSRLDCIDMLDALPPEDALFYSSEQNVIDLEGKSEAVFLELETRYGFIGGEKEEYIKYLSRGDVQHLWEWDSMSNIRAVAGISTVPKKNQVDQRKLVMQVAANYMFSDPTVRAHLGMHGGSALARCFVAGDAMAVASCDEDSAFTHVRVPYWMSRWQAGPPVQAREVWHLL